MKKIDKVLKNSLINLRPIQVYAGMVLLILYAFSFMWAVRFMPEFPGKAGFSALASVTWAISIISAIFIFRGVGWVRYFLMILISINLLVSLPVFFEAQYYLGVFVCAFPVVACYFLLCRKSFIWYRLSKGVKRGDLTSELESKFFEFNQKIKNSLLKRPALVIWLCVLVSLPFLFLVIAVPFNNIIHFYPGTSMGSNTITSVIEILISFGLGWVFISGFYNGIGSVTILFVILLITKCIGELTTIIIKSPGIFSIMIEFISVILCIGVVALRFNPLVRGWYVECANAKK